MIKWKRRVYTKVSTPGRSRSVKPRSGTKLESTSLSTGGLQDPVVGNLLYTVPSFKLKQNALRKGRLHC